MKKRLFTIAFMALFAVVGAKAFIALFSYQTLEKIKLNYQSDIAIKYSWISSSFDGHITLHDVSVTPYQLKRSFYIPSIELQYKSFLDMLIKLPDLKEGNISGIVAVTLPSIQSPLKGRDFDQWPAIDDYRDWLKPFGLFACGSESRISHNSLQKMGVKELKLALELNRNTSTNGDVINLSLNFFQRGAFEIQSVWDENSFSESVFTLKLELENLKALSISHQESGYFRRLSNYCSELPDLSRDDYSSLAAREWRIGLQSIGILTNKVAGQVYRDYLRLGGELNLDLDFPKRYPANDFKSLIDANLAQHFGLSIKLNDAPVRGVSIYLDPAYFNPPKPVVIKEKLNAKPIDKVKKPFYQQVDYQDLSVHQGREVTVIRKDKRVFKGELLSVNDTELILSQYVKGGKVDYSLKPNEIFRIDVKLRHE